MKSFKCPECGLTNWTTAVECKRCRFLFQPVSDEYQAAENVADGQQSGYQNQPNFEPQNNWSPNGAYNQPPNYQHRGYPPPNYQYGQSVNLKSGLAIASMVLGILGFVTSIFLVGIVFAPIGLILGIAALVKANKKPHLYGGKGFAIAGIVMGAMVTLFVPIILAIFIPSLVSARRAANEGSAISSLRTLAGAEETLMSVAGGKSCGDLRMLGAKQLIDPILANGEKSGYRFTIVDLPVIGGGCEIHAVPSTTSGIGATGVRSFYFSTEDGVLRAADKKGKFADNSAPPLDAGRNDYSNQPPKIAVR